MPRVPRGLALLAAAFALAPALTMIAGQLPEAGAYEFWTRARTSGEAYQLRGFRLLGGELTVSRRRFTQSVGLVLYDLGDLERRRRRAGRTAAGPVVSWHSELRLEHDFGSFLTGRLATGPTSRQDALDVIPELDESALALALLYGHLTIAGLFDDRLELELGRMVPLDATGALPLDGISVRAAVAAHVEVRARAGLAVRDSSPWSLADDELDGTPGAACQEYVEAAAGQPGRWQLIDRARAIRDGRYTSDYELCPQRDVLMPTWSLAVASRGLARFHGELGYRVARSRTVGVFGAVDRLPTPDLGLYPNEQGQAPAWGTNLEQVYATAEGRWRWGALTVAPSALVRASLVHGVIDRAEVSAAVQRGRHRLVPSASRFVPTFDADSIWNVFGARPSFDLAAEYRYDGAVMQLQTSAWARRYDGDAAAAAWAWGGSGQLTRALARRWRASGRALADGGLGGRRLATDGTLQWQAGRARVSGRGAVVWVTPDADASAAAARAVTWTAAAATTVQVTEGVAVHSVLEVRVGDEAATVVRALGVLEVALESER